MLKLCYEINDLDFRQLMDVYEETNQITGRENYPNEIENLQILFAEQDFYQYLDLFFKYPDAKCAVWVEEERYLAALRMEGYQGAYIITALEVLPGARGKGYGTKLLKAVQDISDMPLYSHVQKQNVASLAVHKKCNFTVVSQEALFIDGVKRNDHYTLMWKC